MDGMDPALRDLLPSEYSKGTDGVFTVWDFHASQRRKRTSLITSVGTYFKNKRNAAVSGFRRLPVLYDFFRDISTIGGWRFTVLVGIHCVQTLEPIVDLYVSRQLLRFTTQNAVPPSPQQVALLAGVHLVKMFMSIFLNRTAKRLASSILFQINLDIAQHILELHRSLSAEALALPSNVELISKLEDICATAQLNPLRDRRGGWYSPDSFDPLLPLSIVRSTFGIATQSTIFLRQLVYGGLTTLLVPISITLLRFNINLYERGDDHVALDLSNDDFMRMQVAYAVAREPTLRREVNTLNLMEFLVEEFKAARLRLTQSVDTLGDSYDRDYSRYDTEWSSILRDGQSHEIFGLAAFTLQTAYLSRANLLSFTEYSFFSSKTSELLWSVMDFQNDLEKFRRGMRKIEAYYSSQKLLQESTNPTTKKSCETYHPLPGRKGMELEFRNVSFSYSGSSAPALSGVSFKVEPGQLVSIVGHNGSGKSTLISLLSLSPGLGELSGEILVNGRNIGEYDRASLMGAMSFTFQTSPTLPFTISEYVGLGSLEHRTDDARIAESLAFAAADQVVSSLADKVHTYAGGSVGDIMDSRWNLPRVVRGDNRVPYISYETVGGVEKDVEANAERGAAANLLNDYTFTSTTYSDSKADLKPEMTPTSTPETTPPSAAELALWTTDSAPTTPGSTCAVIEKEKDVQYSNSSGPREGFTKLVTYVWPPPMAEPGKPVQSIWYPSHSPKPAVLSGGQWQRIALSRSLMKKDRNELLVFDEPAASLDPSAEASLFDKILELKGTSTILFSTHRFNITSNSDLILMFKGGKLIEKGTHSELMKIEEGEYRRLWNLQARGYQIDPEGKTSQGGETG